MIDRKARAQLREHSLQVLKRFRVPYKHSNNAGVVYVPSPKGDFTLALHSQNWNRGSLQGNGILALSAQLRLEGLEL